MTGKSLVTTFESRLMIENARPIVPDGEESIMALVTDRRFASDLRNRLGNRERLVRLSPMLSAHLVGKLAEVRGNRDEMRRRLPDSKVRGNTQTTGPFRKMR